MAGTKDDSGKVPMDLLPYPALKQTARGMGFGAGKYGRFNFREGLAWGRYYAALQRHMGAWSEGEDFDPETGIHHVAHAACNTLMLLQNILDGVGIDDRCKVFETGRSDWDDRSGTPDARPDPYFKSTARKETVSNSSKNETRAAFTPPNQGTPEPAYQTVGAHAPTEYVKRGSTNGKEVSKYRINKGITSREVKGTGRLRISPPEPMQLKPEADLHAEAAAAAIARADEPDLAIEV